MVFQELHSHPQPTRAPDPSYRQFVESISGAGLYFLVTIKLPKDPQGRPHPLSCRHRPRNHVVVPGGWSGHCDERECPNYLNSCPAHAMATGDDIPEHCTRRKRTAKCPAAANEMCTDSTGEHHTLLVQAPTAEKAESAIRDRGFDHITRIEHAWLIQVG